LELEVQNKNSPLQWEAVDPGSFKHPDFVAEKTIKFNIGHTANGHQYSPEKPVKQPIRYQSSSLRNIRDSSSHPGHIFVLGPAIQFLKPRKLFVGSCVDTTGAEI